MRKKTSLARARPLRGKTASPTFADGWSRNLWDDGRGMMAFMGGGSGSTVWPRPTMRDLEYWCSVHPVARGCLYEIATTFVEPEVQVGRMDDGEFVSMDNHPTLELLQMPNPFMGWRQFAMAGMLYLQATGIWYVQKVRGESNADTSGRLKAIYSWPSSWVVEDRETIGEFRGPVRGYNVHGQAGRVPPENMIRIWYPDPGDPWRPAGPGESAYNDVRIDVERENYQAEMIINTPSPGVGINTGSRGIPEGQRQKYEEEMNNAFGRGNRGGACLLGGDGAGLIEYPGLRDLDWPGITALNETRICTAFQVPPIIVGTRAGLDKSSYANYEHARKSFGDETMAPLYAMVGDGLTRGLLRAEGIGDLEIRFDFESLGIFQESEDSRDARVLGRLAAGVISVNQARIELGYDPDPDPAFDELPQRGQEMNNVMSFLRRPPGGASVSESPAPEPVADPESEDESDGD